MAIEEQLITKNLELWASAVKEKRAAGRGKSRKKENHGTKKLRELILDLGIKGKLAQADPKDEPASELLAHILKTKDQLAKDGLIKKQKSLGRIEDHELPFAIATNWEWVRLGEIADIVRGVTYRKADASDIKSPNTIPLMRANNIDGELNYNDLIHITSDLVKDNQGIREGDVLIAMSSGSADLVGKAAQAKEDLGKTFGAFCGVVRSFTPALFDYFGFFFQTPFYRKQTRESGKGIGIQNLNQGALSSLLVPIPPLAEQHRIVAKVDELMALCDQLEQEQENNLRTHETLVSTLLNALTSAATDASQFADAWEHIQDNFDILFTTESSVDQLKQTILQLAVMGKLLLQDENDSPAEKLLEQISIEKAHLVKTGKIKKQKKPSHLAPEDEPFRLPSGWTWCSLLDICTLENGDRSKNYPNKSMLVETGIPFVNAGDLENGYISEKANSFITEERYEILNSGKFQNGDILFCLRGSLGKSAIVNGFNKGAIASSLVIIRSFSAINEHFLQKYFESPFAAHMLSLYDNGTAQPNLSATDLGKFCVPIPPYKEQFRIVSKIDELLSVCDQLKANLSTAQEIQATLADSIVEQTTVHSPA